MKVFITGGSGLLGRHLIPSFQSKGCSVEAPSHREFDITSQSKPLFSENVAVINLAAYVNVALCEQNPKEAFRVNADHLDWLAQQPPWVQVYHISTDYVYDGNTKDSRETDLLNPWCVYGKSKAAGDMRLLSYCCPNVHIVRLSFKDVKWAYPVAFDDVNTNADTVDVIADLLVSFVLSSPVGGVYNLGTPTKTPYQLAVKNNPSVTRGLLKETNILTIKPELTMNLTKFRKIIGEE